MELRHLRYFMAVAQELNFTRAAEILCIAQPPLSRQIQDLENELGVKLFIRKHHALTLTREGEIFQQYAARVLELIEHSTDEIREMSQGLQGTVNLGSVEGSAPNLIAGWISEFDKENPQVQYNLWNGNSDDVAARVQNGLCDFAVIMEPHNQEGVEYIRIYEEEWIAIIPLSNPLAKKAGDTVSFKELEEYDLIIPSRQSRQAEIGKWFGECGASPKIRCRIAHTMSAIQLARKGIGIALYPMSAGEIADMKQVAIKRLDPPPMAKYILIWDKYRPISHAAFEFLKFIRSKYENGISDI